MGDEIFIGNVRFNKSDIVKSTTSRTADGSKLYSVFLKNGTKMHFYDQSANSNARVIIGYDVGNENKYGTSFAGIQGMVIEGSDKDDYYHLRDCDYYEVNVKNGGKDEVRIVNTDGEPQSATVNNDYQDNAYTVDTSQHISMSEGFFISDNLKPRTKNSEIVNNSHNKPPQRIGADLADLSPVTSIVTQQNNEVREYKDSNGNTVIRVDYMNDDPEELYAEEEVISPDGRLISYTKRSSDGQGIKGSVWFDKYIFDENGKPSKVIVTRYDNGKLVYTKERAPESEDNAKLIATVMPGIVIEDTEMRQFLEDRGATLVGHF